jgi:hypothetical protein
MLMIESRFSLPASAAGRSPTSCSTALTTGSGARNPPGAACAVPRSRSRRRRRPDGRVRREASGAELGIVVCRVLLHVAHQVPLLAVGQDRGVSG